MRTKKTAKSVVRDSYYLRGTFAPVCPQLAIKKISAKGKKRPASQPLQYREANYFELLTTTDFSTFIATQVRRKAL